MTGDTVLKQVRDLCDFWGNDGRMGVPQTRKAGVLSGTADSDVVCQCGLERVGSGNPRHSLNQVTSY